jgi:AraC-like DNA-binding protein
LERIFKQYLNRVPSQYYLELRLNKARQMLMQTSKSIIQIGLSCGFSSGPHFPVRTATSLAQRRVKTATSGAAAARSSSVRRQPKRAGLSGIPGVGLGDRRQRGRRSTGASNRALHLAPHKP